MTCDHIDLTQIADTEFVVWVRSCRRAHHWKPIAIGQLQVLEGYVMMEAVHHRRWSYVILPKGVSPSGE